jgi:hypothetical protein
LLGFDFTVEYKPGANNVVADVLYRHDMETMVELAALSAPSFHFFDTLRAELATNPALRQLTDDVVVGARSDKWRVIDGLVMVDDRVFMPTTSPVIAGGHRWCAWSRPRGH